MHVFCCRALCIVTITKPPPTHWNCFYLYGNQKPNTTIPQSKNSWKMLYLGPKPLPNCGVLTEGGCGVGNGGLKRAEPPWGVRWKSMGIARSPCQAFSTGSLHGEQALNMCSKEVLPSSHWSTCPLMACCWFWQIIQEFHVHFLRNFMNAMKHNTQYIIKRTTVSLNKLFVISLLWYQTSVADRLPAAGRDEQPQLCALAVSCSHRFLPCRRAKAWRGLLEWSGHMESLLCLTY